MNTIQTLSNLFLFIVDWLGNKIPVLKFIFTGLFNLIIPYQGYKFFKTGNYSTRLWFLVYITGVILTFGLFSILTYAFDVAHVGAPDLEFNPTLYPDQPDRILFFDDIYNLANYLLIVPLYLVAGVGFVLTLCSLDNRLIESGKPYNISVKVGPKPIFGGVIFVILYIAILLFAHNGYKVDVLNTSTKETLFWFQLSERGNNPHILETIYLIINGFLAAFAILVVLLHLELFRWSYLITGQLRTLSKNNTQLFIDDENKIKEWLEPFAKVTNWSKLFAICCAFNLYTWRASGISVQDSPNSVSVFWWIWAFLLVIISVWLISLPRYRVQYEILKIRQASRVYDYLDIRKPSSQGWSSVLDWLLLSLIFGVVITKGDLNNLYSIFTK